MSQQPQMTADQVRQMYEQKIQQAQSAVGANAMQTFAQSVKPLSDFINGLPDHVIVERMENLIAIETGKPKNRAERRKANKVKKKNKTQSI